MSNKNHQKYERDMIILDEYTHVKTLSKDDFILWYLKEMRKLFPNATEGMDYSIKDAEFSYNELHNNIWKRIERSWYNASIKEKQPCNGQTKKTDQRRTKASCWWTRAIYFAISKNSNRGEVETTWRNQKLTFKAIIKARGNLIPPCFFFCAVG